MSVSGIYRIKVRAGQFGLIGFFQLDGRTRQAFFTQKGNSGTYFTKPIEGEEYWAQLYDKDKVYVTQLLPYQETGKKDVLMDTVVVPTIETINIELQGKPEKLPAAVFDIDKLIVKVHSVGCIKDPLYNTRNRFTVSRNNNGYFDIQFSPIEPDPCFDVDVISLCTYKAPQDKYGPTDYFVAKTPNDGPQALVTPKLSHVSIVGLDDHRTYPGVLTRTDEGRWVVVADSKKIVEFGGRMSDAKVPLKFMRVETRTAHNPKSDEGEKKTYQQYIFHTMPGDEFPDLFPIKVTASVASLALYDIDVAELEEFETYVIPFIGSASKSKDGTVYVNFQIKASQLIRFSGLAVSRGTHASDKLALTVELLVDYYDQVDVNERTKIPYELLRQHGVWGIEDGTKFWIALSRNRPDDVWQTFTFHGQQDKPPSDWHDYWPETIDENYVFECVVVKDWDVRNPSNDLPFYTHRPGMIDLKEPNQTFGWKNHCLTYVECGGLQECIVIHASLLKANSIETLPGQSRIWLKAARIKAAVYTKTPVTIYVANTIERIERTQEGKEEGLYSTITATYVGVDSEKTNRHIFLHSTSKEDIRFTDYNGAFDAIPKKSDFLFRLRINDEGYVKHIISATKK